MNGMAPLQLTEARITQFGSTILPDIKTAGTATIAAGLNGSGKTRIVDAFRMLRQIARDGAGQWGQNGRGHEALVMTVHAQSRGDDGRKYTYSIACESGPAEGILSETLDYQANVQRSAPPLRILEHSRGQGRICKGPNGPQTGETPEFGPIEMADAKCCALRAFGNVKDYAHVCDFANWVDNWRIEADCPRPATDGERERHDGQLPEYGDNIPGTVDWLGRNDRELWNRFQNGIQALTQGRISLIGTHNTYDKGESKHEGTVFAYASLSGGQQVPWTNLSAGLRAAARFELLLQISGTRTLLIADCPDSSMDDQLSQALAERVTSPDYSWRP